LRPRTRPGATLFPYTTLFRSRNKFVSPTAAGTMDAASLGILAALLLFPQVGLLEKLLVAFAFALAGSLLFMQVLERVRYKDEEQDRKSTRLNSSHVKISYAVF